MAKDVFTTILERGLRKGFQVQEQRARDWFRAQANRKFNVTRNKIFKARPEEYLRDGIKVGSMYMFVYDAKTKDELPYWDRFPLIFPVDVDKDGFYGINFHYLPYPLRAKLMDALHDLTTNRRYDERTRVRLSYEILKGSSQLALFKPTFKRYLWSHVKSQFVFIHPSEWDIALFLRVESFMKKSKYKVWTESEKIIKQASRQSPKRRR